MAAASLLPRQDTQALPLAPSVRARLLAAGYRTVADLEGVAAALSPAEASSALACIPRYDTHTSTLASLAGGRTAAELLAAEAASTRVITFCADLDRLLGGGAVCGQVTEFCGAPAIGKTQLCMQMCMDVQIPASFGGVGGAAVYIDTEGSLVPERAAEIAASVASHLARVAARAGGSTPQGAARRADAAALTPSRLMGGVTVLRARDAAEQVAAVSSLTGLVDAAAVGGGPPIKLVVLDSVAFLVRAGVVGGSAGGDATSGRAAALSATAAALTALARSRGVAVVLTNQVTTRVTGGEGASSPSSPSSSRLVPALGAAWAHVPATRVLLHWGRGGKRLATLVKSPSLPGGSAEYRVGLEGVRGVAVVAAAAAAAVAGGGGKRGREDG